jgi:homoserine dehydrogenase
LAARGIDARALDAAGLALRTRGPALDADPVDVDVAGLRAALGGSAVLVVPGFVGVDGDGEPSLLGRGGSDLTALFLADRLDAVECRLLKDVDGVHARDPRLDPEAPVFRRASWDVVLAVGGSLVQGKAVRFARERGRAFRVAAFGGEGTWVGAGPVAGPADVHRDPTAAIPARAPA